MQEPELAEFMIYPNPADDYIFITTRNIRGHAMVRILDISGRFVLTESKALTQEENTIQLSTNSLSSGIYFIEVSNGKGNAAVRKLVVR